MIDLNTKRLVLAAALCLSLGIACQTEPSTEAGRSELEGQAASALSNAETTDPTLGPWLRTMVAYAVIPEVKKGGVIAGGAYGRGVVYQNGAVIGFCDVSQQTIGAQFGGQTFTEIVAMQTADALQRFKTGNTWFDAHASAVAVNAGASASTKFMNGVAVLISDEQGLMAEASVG